MSTPHQDSLSIIIPAKNESATLPALVDSLAEQLPGAEILVINDGSTDNTLEALEGAACRVVTQPYSMGNGAAIKRGVREAKGDILAMLDADGQHTASELLRVLEKFHSADYDLVVGARRIEHHATPGRRLANQVFNRLASWMTEREVLDLTSGMRVVRAAKFREFLHLLPNGFSYPTTSTMAFFRSGYAVGYQPIEVEQRDDKGTSHIRPLKDGMRFLVIILRIGSLYSPLKLFLPISLMIFALATLLYGYTFFSQGRFTNMSALLYSTSLLTFLIGMVSEQITAITFQKKT